MLPKDVEQSFTLLALSYCIVVIEQCKNGKRDSIVTALPYQQLALFQFVQFLYPVVVIGSVGDGINWALTPKDVQENFCR